MELRIKSTYEPLPAQVAFHLSREKFKGYGGAMGGGKSRALCEEAFQAALDYPGIEILMGRNQHTAISDTTRKTMFREVLPHELVKRSRIIKSGGFDFIQFPNNSVISFVGVEDPIKFMSGEFGLIILDEAHEIDEDTMLLLNTRLRQKCADCRANGLMVCNHLPRQVLLGFNPDTPGHWLWKLFFDGSRETQHGQIKSEVKMDEYSKSLGDAVFIRALATHNPYLPEGYVERELAGMKDYQVKRYLEGQWVFASGECIFDLDALSDYAQAPPPAITSFTFEAKGIGDVARRKKGKGGAIQVFVEPSASRLYAIGCDPASGYGADFSSAFVIDLADMRIVAEFHDQLDQDELAEQLHFLGKWYGRSSGCERDAIIAVESSGGFGEPVIIGLRDGKSGRPPYNMLYRHQLDSHIKVPLTQRYGYPMNKATRPVVLGELQEAVRERALPWMPHGLAIECHTFCEFDKGTPLQRAQAGCHDDRVLAAAITLELYRQKGLHPEREARVAKKFKKRFHKPKRRESPRGLDLSPWK